MAAAFRSVSRLQPFLRSFSTIKQQTFTAFTKPGVFHTAIPKSFSTYNSLLSERRYSKEHEWVLTEGSEASVGITDFAQSELGDIVFVELPDVGTDINKDDSVGVVESVKAVSDIYCPVAGTVIEVNRDLEDHPELVNDSPLEDGWFFKMTLTDPSSVDSLMTEKEYDEYLRGL